MLEALKHLLPAYTAKLVCVALIYSVFRYINNTASEEIRLRVALWLLGSRASQRPWQYNVPALFLSVFGYKVLSRKSVRATLIVTLIFGFLLHVSSFFISQSEVRRFNSIAVSICLAGIHLFPNIDNIRNSAGGAEEIRLGLVSPTIDDDAIRATFEMGFSVFSESPPISVWGLLIAFLCVYNLPFEFLSLTKTRWVLLFVYRKAESIGRLASALIVDLVMSIGIAACSVALLSVLYLFFILRDDFRSYLPLDFENIEAVIAHQFVVTAILPLVHIAWMIVTVLMAFLWRPFIWASKKAPIFSRLLSEKRIEKEPITLIGEMTAGLAFLTLVYL